mgnify:CR=1 FL=1
MESNDNNYKKADRFLIDTLGLTGELTYKQVKSKIRKYLNEQYKGKVPSWKIKIHTDDFTESICLELGISQI